MAEETDDEAFEQLLNEFISSQLDDVDISDSLSASKAESASNKDILQEKDDFSDVKPNSQPEENDDDDPEIAQLRPEEKALARAYRNFSDAITIIADEANLPLHDFQITPQALYPNYKPSLGQKIVDDVIAGWDILMKAFPDITSKISPDMSDEKLLEFAEKCEHETLQFAIISYIEVLIEMEGCEISYKDRKLRKEKRKLEREIYEEHQRRADRARAYINAIEQKEFPINAERLVKNFFKTSTKDPQGAYQILTENPAVFSPIEFNKIKPRFFGLLKVGPQDGIRMNRIIGNFLKHLKI